MAGELVGGQAAWESVVIQEVLYRSLVVCTDRCWACGRTSPLNHCTFWLSPREGAFIRRVPGHYDAVEWTAGGDRPGSPKFAAVLQGQERVLRYEQ